MKKIITAVVVGMLSAGAFADVYVQGYYRADGTYVPGHYQSSPDASRLNNYSTQPNVNPYTGQPGMVNPYPQQRSAQPCYRGPNGGTYTVGPNGMKNYGGC